MKKIKCFTIVLLIVYACTKQENNITPSELAKNPLTQTGTSLNDTIKNSTVTSGISTIIGCNNDSVYKDTVVHFDISTKEKLVGKWIETSNSFGDNIDTLEFTYDSKFYIHTKRHFEDTAGNYNDYFMNTVYKTITSDSIILIRRPYGFRKKTGIIRKIWLRNDTIFGNEMDNSALANVRQYYYSKSNKK
jgi:hypothetical protein